MDRIHVMELVRAYQVGEMPRREFLKRSAAAVGSVAAANMLLAACAAFPNDNPPPVVDEAAPSADEDIGLEGDLVRGTVTFGEIDGQALTGYLAYIGEGGAGPAVIVIQEWWGLNEHIKDVARRFARAGFVALAPDLYHGRVTTEPDEARKLAMELDTEAAVAEIAAGMRFLQEQPFVSSEKVGVVGYCMGGGLVVQTALRAPELGAGVVFYGRPLSESDARRVTVPIQTHIGTRDGITVPSVEAMHAGLDAAGVANEVYVYEGAQHAFFNDTRASYDAAAAADAWDRTLGWFRDHL